VIQKTEESYAQIETFYEERRKYIYEASCPKNASFVQLLSWRVFLVDVFYKTFVDDSGSFVAGLNQGEMNESIVFACLAMAMMPVLAGRWRSNQSFVTV
jgi:hypothetical protein